MPRAHRSRTTAPPLTVRDAIDDDEPDLVALARDGFESSLAFDWQANAKALLQGARGGRVVVLVATRGARRVGYVNLRPWLEGGWIDQVVVDGAARRAGVGGALLREAVERARSRGMRFVAAMVSARDERALSFWRASGWKRVGRIERAVAADADGILFHLPLSAGTKVSGTR
jgi:ribosomal protein S18 acetylase RimI-like enzyme